MIFDKENYDKFAAGDIDYRACTEHKELNKEVRTRRGKREREGERG